MYKSIIKSCQVKMNAEDTVLIDNNGRIAREIELLKEKTVRGAEEELPEDTPDGFSGGLEAMQVDALLSDDNDSAIIKEEKGGRVDGEETAAQAEEILSEARAEAEGIRAHAMQEEAQIRKQAFDEGKQEGYQAGYQEGMGEAEALRRQLEEEKDRMEREYQAQIEELEPEFIRVITKVYEQVFQVDLKKEHAIVARLIENVMQKIEGSGNYLIHVSKEDYSYTSMQKETLAASVSGNASLEIVEDVTLGAGDCMIETDSGIFDCGLGTQLEELSSRLRLLSYSGDRLHT